MSSIEIYLDENVKHRASTVDGKPVIICEAEGIQITLPASLVRKLDLSFRNSTNVRHCACGYCGTSCSDNGSCYCGNCYFDC